VADKDCADFTWQQDAQAAHEQHPEWGLDNDDLDNVACEALPLRPATAPDPTTTTTTPPLGALPFTGPADQAVGVGGALLLLAGVALVAFTRKLERS
jgi:hypothetical protein